MMDQYAYRLAPWRKQLRNIMTVVAFSLFFALMAWIYLSLSASMTDMKLQIQELHDERNELSREIADMLTQEGELTAYQVMERRARNAGFIPIDFTNEDSYTYALVGGFRGDAFIDLQPVQMRNPLPVSKIKPDFQISLRQWLVNFLQSRRGMP